VNQHLSSRADVTDESGGPLSARAAGWKQDRPSSANYRMSLTPSPSDQTGLVSPEASPSASSPVLIVFPVDCVTLVSLCVQISSCKDTGRLDWGPS
jgi:hypothetical protein